MDDPGFWWDFAGRIGTPIFAATLVACLLEGQFNPLHGALLAAGFALIGLDHWHHHHHGHRGG